MVIKQLPTLLLQIVGTAQMVYLSSAPDAQRHFMYIVDNHLGDRQTITELPGVRVHRLTALTDAVDIPGLGQAIVPTSASSSDGHWGTSRLAWLPLDRYVITHDEHSGKLARLSLRR